MSENVRGIPSCLTIEVTQGQKESLLRMREREAGLGVAPGGVELRSAGSSSRRAAKVLALAGGDSVREYWVCAHSPHSEVWESKFFRSVESR